MRLTRLIPVGLLLLSLFGCAYGTNSTYGGVQGSNEPQLTEDWQNCPASQQLQCYQMYGR